MNSIMIKMINESIVRPLFTLCCSGLFAGDCDDGDDDGAAGGNIADFDL